MSLRVAVFGSSQAAPGTPAYEEAFLLGRLLARADVEVVNGGYGGVMAAASAGAAAAGGRVIGVTAPTVFPDRTAANPHLTEERPAPSIIERIHTLLDISDAAIALPGNLGTFTELVAAWNVSFVAPFSGKRPKPLVAVGPTWREVLEFLGPRLDAPTELIEQVATVEEAAATALRALHASARKPGR